VAEQEAKQKADRARARRQSQFRAAPLPRFPQPAPPARSERLATRAVTPKLAVETRSAVRAAFNATVAENKRKEEVTSHHIHQVSSEGINGHFVLSMSARKGHFLPSSLQAASDAVHHACSEARR